MRILGIALLFAPVSAFATVVNITPADASNLGTLLNALQPGDQAVFQGGTYALPTGRLGLTLVGTAAQPITLRTDGTRVVLQRPDANQNTLNFDNAQYLDMDGFEFSGGSEGVRFYQASYVTFRNCSIHDTQGSALTANNPGQTYVGLQLVHNEMFNTALTGEGMYLGCNNDGCRVQNSLIAGNYVHDTNGPNVTAGFGTAIQMKEGSSGNVLRDNVVHDSGAPCILVDSAAGHGPANTVERNLLYRCGDHGIQASQDAIIQNNIVLGVASDGIAAQPHQAGIPQNLSILHNTVVNPTGNSISVRMPAGPVTVANNALYGLGGTAFLATGTASNILFSGNVGVGAVSGITATLAPGSLTADFVNATNAGAPPMDLFPKAGGALPDAGAAAYVPLDDFNSTLRHGVPDVGAYAFAAGGNPGWTIGPGFKADGGTSADGGSMVDSGTTPDSGSSADSGSSTDAGPRADSGVASDAGGGGDGGVAGTSKSGCGCAAGTSEFSALLLSMLALATRLASRRRSP